jgi:hypothetical protein
MPWPDCACQVINGKTGYSRDNASWVIGRIVRDYDKWMDPAVPRHLESMLQKKGGQHTTSTTRNYGHHRRKRQVGLCVAFYNAADADFARPGHDTTYFTGWLVVIIQLGIAAVPCGLYDDWGILLVTAVGTVLAFATGSLSQWPKEKWACGDIRADRKKTVVLTKGNGSQHAIVITSDGRGLDLEDLAVGAVNLDVTSSIGTRATFVVLACFWVLLLITAAGIKENTWYLLAVGAIGILQNMIAAGVRRTPAALGVPIEYDSIIGDPSVMQTLYAVERKQSGLGRSMLPIFFPGKLTDDEVKEWKRLEEIATPQQVPVPNLRSDGIEPAQIGKEEENEDEEATRGATIEPMP